MIAYTLSNETAALPNHATLWSRVPLRPLAGEVATPFSYSTLQEIVSRAWYSLYDRLGFAPQPAQKVLRYHSGFIYLNLSKFAALEAEQAGLQPPAFWLGDQRVAASAWEKPGLLGGLSLGRKQKRIDTLLNELGSEIDGVTQRARAWHIKTQEMRWTQAEVLQIMEEIERVSIDSMVAFLAVRYGLLRHANRLLHLLHPERPDAMVLAGLLGRLSGALGGVTDLIEVELATQLLTLGQQAAEDEPTMDWLRADQFDDWLDTLPNRALREQAADFFTHYGHRAAGEGEISRARWLDNPRPVFHAILACARDGRPLPKGLATNGMDELLRNVGKARSEVEQHVQAIRNLLPLQSRALHAFAYILAGTHQWALVAGGEAAADGRLANAEGVFLFELEEIKEMMTGEWNISSVDEIRARQAERQADYDRWQRALEQAEYTAGEMLIEHGGGLLEAMPVSPSPGGLPAATGTANGPLRRWVSPQPHHCGPAIVGASQFDSGWSLTLPVAKGYAAAYGAPVDPFVAAARAWVIPTIAGLDDDYRTLVDGAETEIDGSTGEVEQ